MNSRVCMCACVCIGGGEDTDCKSLQTSRIQPAEGDMHARTHTPAAPTPVNASWAPPSTTSTFSTVPNGNATTEWATGAASTMSVGNGTDSTYRHTQGWETHRDIWDANTVTPSAFPSLTSTQAPHPRDVGACYGSQTSNQASPFLHFTHRVPAFEHAHAHGPAHNGVMHPNVGVWADSASTPLSAPVYRSLSPMDQPFSFSLASAKDSAMDCS